MEKFGVPREMGDKAKELRDKIDGFSFTTSRDERRYEFEREMRRDEAGDPSDLYSHKNVRSRRDAETQYKEAAKERNKYRSFFGRFFKGQNATADDVMRDEAERINTLVDTRVRFDEGWTSHQEAADDIVPNSSEFEVHSFDMFGDNEHRRAIREYITEVSPQIEDSLNHGSLGSAVRLFEDVVADAGTEEDVLRDDFYRLYIPDKLQSIIVSHNAYAAEAFRKDIVAIDTFHCPHIQYYLKHYLEALIGYYQLNQNDGVVEKLSDLKAHYDRFGAPLK